MLHWLISDRFLEAANVSSSEFWDHIFLQVENDTTDLWIQGFIDWVGSGAGSAVRCGVALSWEPSLDLVLLNFLPLCQIYAAVAQQFGIVQTCCCHAGDDPMLISLRNNPCHVIAFDSGPSSGGPCNAGDVSKMRSAELSGHIWCCIITLSVAIFRTGVAPVFLPLGLWRFCLPSKDMIRNCQPVN